MENLKEYISIAVVVIPVVVVIVRWIWHFGSVQAWAKKSRHHQVIEEVVETAINLAEQWAKGNEEADEEKKKAKAMEFFRSAAKKLGVPQSFMDDELISGYIEAALNKVDW